MFDSRGEKQAASDEEYSASQWLDSAASGSSGLKINVNIY